MKSFSANSHILTIANIFTKYHMFKRLATALNEGKKIQTYYKQSRIQSKKSLSLIEMIVAILVMSIITATSMKYGTRLYKQYQYDANQKKLENIQIALKNYFQIHGRLPRPASYNNLTATDSEYGKELTIDPNCTDVSCHTINDAVVYSNNKIQYSKMGSEKNTSNAGEIIGIYNEWVQYTANDYIFSGIVPFKELNLTEHDAMDQYGNFIEYWVGQYITLKPGEPIIDTSKINIATTSDTTFFGKPYKVGYNIKYFNNTSYNNYPCPKVNGSFNCDIIDNGNKLYSVNITQNPPIEKLSTTDRSSNLFISNENTVTYLIPPYGLRLKDIKTDDFIDKSGSTAYVLVSHGRNGSKTCSITKKSLSLKVHNDLALVSDNYKKYEAQNCINAVVNTTLNIIGRNESAMQGKEFLFYTGVKTDFFDDQIVYSSLEKLLLNE